MTDTKIEQFRIDLEGHLLPEKEEKRVLKNRLGEVMAEQVHKNREDGETAEAYRIEVEHDNGEYLITVME